jgi:DNA-binding response OmpR family regulator
MRKVVPWAAVELDAVVLLARNDPDAVVLDLMQPQVTGRRPESGCRDFGRGEAS